MDEAFIGTTGNSFDDKRIASSVRKPMDGHDRLEEQARFTDQSTEEAQERGHIYLLKPGVGEVTPPLQLHAWPAPPLEPPQEASLWSWQRFLTEHDRSLPRPVEFSWLPPTNIPKQEPKVSWTPAMNRLNNGLRYDLELALDGNSGGKGLPDEKGFSGEKAVYRQLPGPRAEVYNLRVGASYLWKVTARQGQQIVAESPVGCFTTDPTPPRWIRVPGTTNVRDLGGWPLPNGRRVRQGLFYRGSEMNSHCTIEEAGRRVLVDELGIRTDIDLRGQGEDRQAVLDAARVDYLNFPVLAYDSVASPQFTGRFRALFGHLANRRAYPLYLHCWGGADRTGTIAFLVGALLGMHPDDLATDYELTSLSIWGERLSSSDAYLDLLQTLALFAPLGATIQTQVERYLRVIGVTNDEIAAIRDILIE